MFPGFLRCMISSIRSRVEIPAGKRKKITELMFLSRWWNGFGSQDNEFDVDSR